MEIILFLLGTLWGLILGTFIEHRQAKQPGHYE